MRFYDIKTNRLLESTLKANLVIFAKKIHTVIGGSGSGSSSSSGKGEYDRRLLGLLRLRCELSIAEKR